MTRSPMVRFENVSKRYGPLSLLDSLGLDSVKSAIVAIFGRSGSGKTTVLGVGMTLEAIDDGVGWVEGEPLTHMKRHSNLVQAVQADSRKFRARIGMVF